MNLIWESQSGLKECGKLCQCLTFLKDTGHHGIFQVRFWCLFFINSFHCKKVQIQRLNVADLITAAEFYSFWLLPCLLWTWIMFFHHVCEIIPFFFLLDLFLTILKANEYGIFWNEVCVWRLGGVSSCFLSLCFELLFHRRHGVLQTDRTMLYSALASNHKQGLWN